MNSSTLNNNILHAPDPKELNLHALRSFTLGWLKIQSFILTYAYYSTNMGTINEYNFENN
jgi:hypothetical protein